MLNQKQVTLIHVAKSQLKLSDEDYRNILMSVCKVNSAKEIKTLEDLRALMRAFEQMGFEQKRAFQSFARKNRIADTTVTAQQIEMIEKLWQKVTKNPDDWRGSLNNFLASRFMCTDVKALSGMKAINVIEALKNMLIKNALVSMSEQISGNSDPVQTQLLNIYKSVKTSFSHGELAAVCACLFYSTPELMQRCAAAVNVLESKMSIHQSTEELPF